MDKKMGWIEAYILFWRNTFNYNGRSRRAEYWKPMIINLFIMIIVSFIFGVISAYQGQKDTEAEITITWISLISSLAIFLPLLGVTIRRLHDVGLKTYHGILTMLSYLIYGVGDFILTLNGTNFLTQMVGRMPDDPHAYIGTILIVFAIIFWVYNLYILFSLLLNSDKGPNKFGENPKRV
ncbi:DUF805 domain-containing protein [Macrococcus animalis]|uniref:DUF805 domain-containing protein n=1 Tax=Macrococcus animalis TaxID=3395467 RepID=UPI0039BE3A3A